MCKEIKLPAESFGIESVGKFLCLLDVADLEKRIIIHLVRDAVFIKDMLHHLPPVDVDLNQEGEPCLELHIHEAEMFIKEIKIIVFTFTIHSIEGKPPVVMLFRLKGLSVFNNREDADQALIYWLILKDL